MLSLQTEICCEKMEIVLKGKIKEAVKILKQLNEQYSPLKIQQQKPKEL